MESFLAFLLPLTIYFLVLGLINRRWRPLVVRGRWDFAGLLFAASGFLLVGGPSILLLLYQRWRIAWLLNHQQQPASLGSEGYYFWLAVLYFVVVVGGAAYLLWRRGDQLAVYNIDPAVFDEILAAVLDRLGLSWSRAGQQWYIGLAGRAAGASTATAELVGDSGRIELDRSATMRHVTLHWVQMDLPLRQEIEDELRRALTQVVTRSNPVGGWFLAVAAVLFGLLTLLTLAALLLPLLAPR